MNSIATLLDKPIFLALGWTLIHFIWQGALIALLYVASSVLLRRFTANVRYAAACGGMLLMLIAPVVTILTISSATTQLNSVAVTGTDKVVQTSEAIAPQPVNQLAVAPESQVEFVPASQPNSIKHWAKDRLPRAIPWLLALWFAGVLFLSLRFAGGLVMIHRLAQVETSSGLQLWQVKLSLLCQRLRVSRPVRLCTSAPVEVPTVIG